MLRRIKILIVLFAGLLYGTVSSLHSAYGIDTMLKVAVEPNLPPYQFVNGDGNYVGVHIDILNSIAKRNNFILEYIPIKNMSNGMEALNDGRVDMVLGAIAKTDGSYYGMSTDSISQSSICMIGRKAEADHIKNNMNSSSFTAVIEDGTISYTFLQNMRTIRYIVVSNQSRAFETLISRKADLLIGVKGSLMYQLDKRGMEEDYTIFSNYMVPIEYTILTKKGDDELINALNTGLYQLRISGEYENIHERWINESKYATKELMRRMLYGITIVVAIVIVVIVINFRMNMLLKRQVSEKTKELRKTNEDLENQIIETRNYNELKNCIVENNPGSIIVFDKDYIITMCNNNALRLIGSSSDITGMYVLDIGLYHDILRGKESCIFAENSKFINEEISIRNNMGDERSYRYDIYQLYDFNDSVRGAILSVEDVTKELKLREEIYEKEKNKALNQIIAGIAHEIRNPLMSIKTFAELIPFKRENSRFQDQMAEYVPREVDRVNNLIKSLIDYAKPEDNHKETILLNDIITSCAVLIDPVLENERMELRVTANEPLVIMADKNQIKQALINILLNGFESMKEKLDYLENKEVKLILGINAWNDSLFSYVQVTDEGMGMCSEEVKKATELFYTTKDNGTGIGLALTKQFVEENEGSISIESTKNLMTKITLKFRRKI